MATRKPFAAFGRVLYANYYDAGEVIDVVTASTSQIVLFFSQGNFTARNKQTGEIAGQCDPGWFSTGNYQDQMYTCTANEPSICWCYDPSVNQGYIPLIEPFILKSGQSSELAIGTNLFLCTGTAQVNGQPYVGPYQISVRTGTATAVATTDVYGLIFK
jgi:hypothetical protein